MVMFNNWAGIELNLVRFFESQPPSGLQLTLPSHPAKLRLQVVPEGDNSRRPTFTFLLWPFTSCDSV